MSLTLERARVMDSFRLKLIALVTMTVDHAAVALEVGTWYLPMREIGRIAFPIYCLLLAEGFRCTRNRTRDLLRLLGLFLLSEPVYDLTLRGAWPDWSNQNVLLTLAIGLSSVWLVDTAGKLLRRREEALAVLAPLACLPGLILAEVLRADYGYGGVLLVLCFYLFRERPALLCLSVLVTMVFTIGFVEIYGIIALLPILLYNGQRGIPLRGWAVKYAFYLYYPAHIAVLCLLQQGVA